MRRSTDPQVIEQYAADESNTFFAERVEAVVFPESAEDVAEVLGEANASGTPVTVSGGGTGLTGARVATCGGIIMTMELMAHAPERAGFEPVTGEHQGLEYTIALDRDGERAWCPPAITLAALDGLLAPALLFPPAPTEMSAQLGGAVAENASGARTFRYGATREWVEALEVVLPTGEQLHVRRGDVLADGRTLRFASPGGTQHEVTAPSYGMPATKNAAGLYAADGMDLIDLFVGSEGILGVVTAALVRVTERPELVSDTAFFATEEAAVAHADALRDAAHEGAPIVSVEFYDPGALRFMADQPQVRPEHQAAIFTEVAVDDPDAIDLLAEIIEASDPLDDWFADSERDREAQRTFRHALPENVNTWLRAHGTDKLCTDYAVPAEAFGAMMNAYHEALARFLKVTGRPNESAVLFGHIGNYHLHVDFLPADAAEEAAAMEQYIFLARTAIGLGGTITAEHGVGKKTLPICGRAVPYLELMYEPEGLAEIAAAKRALDPAWILNPGNMVPGGRA